VPEEITSPVHRKSAEESVENRKERKEVSL
jgi:hypothetical protein